MRDEFVWLQPPVCGIDCSSPSRLTQRMQADASAVSLKGATQREDPLGRRGRGRKKEEEEKEKRERNSLETINPQT